MNLTRIYMTRGGFRNDGPLQGTITLKGPEGEIEAVLDETACREVVTACADALARTGQAASERLRNAVMEAATEKTK